jgi:CPA2 family monovalent cation:H+ antiporter-2
MTASLYSFQKRLFKQEPLQTINLPKTGLDAHVLIAGGGSLGQHVANVLSCLGVDFVITELNYRRINQCKDAGFPVIFGDASQPVVLEAAQADHASLLLITIPDIVVTQSIVHEVRQLNPNLNIVVRAEGIEQMKSLYNSGVYMVILPALEAGLEFARQALLHLSIPTAAIQCYTDSMRQELYSPLYKENADSQMLTRLKSAKDLLELTWVELPSESPLNGKTIRELNIRSLTGVSVVGLINEKGFHPNPEADYCFKSGDMVAIIGTTQARAAFQNMAENSELKIEN